MRALVRVTRDVASPDWHRRRLRQVDVDSGRHNGVGAHSITRVLLPEEINGTEPLGTANIVLEATGPGLTPGRITIVVSSDPAHRVLPTAVRSVAVPLDLEHE